VENRRFQLLDLREGLRLELLRAFISLYDRTFIDLTEREDPSQWYDLLRHDCPPPQPRFHLLVVMPAGRESGIEVWGGLVFEHYHSSHCGLLTYMVIDESYRRRGLARSLVTAATEILCEEARACGQPLRALFGEAEDPKKGNNAHSGMPPTERLRVLARLGAHPIDFPYVQPKLVGGSDRGRHLLLLSFDVPGRRSQRVDGHVVREFLDEFYRALGVEHPEADPDFQMMDVYLRSSVPYKDSN
jgi:GNAT superfamily N-acetyltransferase